MGDSVLLVKLSSLGDVVHTFAAVRDFKRENPTAHLVWAVEEAYLPLVSLHPDVDEIIPVPMRRLRKTSHCWVISSAWRNFLHTFRQQKYDITLDAQGLLKSALLSQQANASRRYGFDFASAREPLASLFYHKRLAVAKNQHAVIRSRQLFARIFHYSIDLEKLDFGLTPSLQKEKTNPYLLFFHGTTWHSKTLPIDTWQQLKKLALADGYEVFLPWGNQEEKQRAVQIIGNSEKCHLLPPLGLTELATWIAGSSGAISVDTGLGHLAGAFGLPVVGVFGATSPAKSGILGQRCKNLGGKTPCYQKDCRRHGGEHANTCMRETKAKEIWACWQALASFP